MADVKKIATRESYGNALTELGRRACRIWSCWTPTWPAPPRPAFSRRPSPSATLTAASPKRIWWASPPVWPPCGFVPFATSFAMFAAGRAFEQVRNSIGYPHLNVKIGATHARHLRGRGRRHPPVQRGHRPHAHHPRHGGHRAPLTTSRPRPLSAPPPNMSARSICASAPLCQPRVPQRELQVRDWQGLKCCRTAPTWPSSPPA